MALQHALYFLGCGLRALLENGNDFFLQRFSYAAQWSVMRLGPAIFAAGFAILSPDSVDVSGADAKSFHHVMEVLSRLQSIHNAVAQAIWIR